MDLSRCRDACHACEIICVETAVHSLAKGEEHPRDLVRLLWDCSEICGIGASFLSRGSPMHPHLCRAAGAVSRECAAACSGRGDPLLDRCAAACRDCAELCSEMAAAHHWD